MKLIRSWPATIPPNRNYVVDQIERFVMADFDYRGLGEIDDDILLLEWDIAVGQQELLDFARHVSDEPKRVRVAPYRLYESFSGRKYDFHPLWVHRRYEDNETRTRFISESDATCHMFGFGMVYLPRHYVRSFLDAWSGHFDDSAFSGWHYRNAADPEVAVDWDVHAVHLHYRLNPTEW